MQMLMSIIKLHVFSAALLGLHTAAQDVVALKQDVTSTTQAAMLVEIRTDGFTRDGPLHSVRSVRGSNI